nr:hypothetical protein [Tanacetum cinerariifolium]
MSSLFADTHNVVAILKKSDDAEDDVTRLQALVDRKKIVISEVVISEILQLDDAEGVSMSAKRTSWNEFSTAMASANQVGDLSTHTTRYISPALTQKVFANMRRVRKGFSGVETPLFEGMLAARQLAEEGIADEQVQDDAAVADVVQENVTEDVAHDADPSPPSHDTPSQEQSSPHQQPQSSPQAPPQAAQKLEIIKLKARVKSAASATISAAKPSIPAAAPTVVAAYTRRRKGVIIKDPEEELSSKTPVETSKLKDKGKGILIETLKPMKKKDQIELDTEYARKLHEEINRDHEEINKDIDWDAAIDHVNQKSKNPQYIKRY